MKKIKDLTLQIIAGANVATAVTMFLVGLSDRINPTEHPIMANIGLIFPGFIFINFCFFSLFRGVQAQVHAYFPAWLCCQLFFRAYLLAA